MNDKPWRVAELIQTSTEILEKNKIEDARLNAELILGQTLVMERVKLYLNYDRPVSPTELSNYRSLFKRRLAREPLQYILGKTEFMSLEFEVSPAVLIPRADTETLVEWVIKNCQNDEQIRILDIGTGSGNIAICLAYYLPKAKVVGVDISDDALKVASNNKKKHINDNKVVFVQTDVKTDNFAKTFKNRFDVIVSNPPYVRCREFKLLQPEVLKYEPKIALADETNKGIFYQKIAQCSIHLLKENGTIFVEIGIGCAQDVKEIFQRYGFNEFEIKKDLAGIKRVLSIKNKCN